MSQSIEEIRFAAAPDVELTLTSFAGGGPTAAPVLLLHGLSQQRHFWNPVVGRLRTRPVAALDQRGHGDSGIPGTRDFSIQACGSDVLAALDRLGWEKAIVVGHSWGASVALHAAATSPDRVVAVGLIDGGLRSPTGMGTREQARERLTPPALGLPQEQVWAMVRAGDLGPYWSPEVEAALSPTFDIDSEGLMRTRLGLERHLRVLDGILDYEPAADLTQCGRQGTPVWAAVCEGHGSRALPAGIDGIPGLLVHRWAGAVHDVPLQWPSLVAGFIDTMVETVQMADGGSL
jgi:pimeloyl-ACP methyl ester carboxylesterase